MSRKSANSYIIDAKPSMQGGGGSCGCKETKPTAQHDPVDIARRWFLKSAAAFSTAVLAPGVTLMAFAETADAQGVGEKVSEAARSTVSPKRRWGLLIDVSKCADGCSACISACAKENGWHSTGRPATDAQWIRKLTVTSRTDDSSFSLPMMCQHCANPPCVDVCPTGASFRRADGIVLVDKHICIGCRYCMLACPYKARSFIHEDVTNQRVHAPRGKGTVESCTLCVHRVDRGGTPACVEACATAGHEAMLFGDLNDPASEIARRVATYRTTQVRADLGCDPGVRYQNI